MTCSPDLHQTGNKVLYPYIMQWLTFFHLCRAQVEFGYPFVARDLKEMEQMLDRLRASAALRQEASRILLAIAKYLSV